MGNMALWVVVSSIASAFAYIVSALINWDIRMSRHSDDSKFFFATFSISIFVVVGFVCALPYFEQFKGA